MRAKFINEFLNESPNSTYSHDDEDFLPWEAGRPFGYSRSDQFIIGDYMQTHDNIDIDYSSYMAGRIWEEEKIIAFWDQVYKTDLLNFMSDISRKIKVSVNELKTNYLFDINPDVEYDEDEDEEKLLELANKYMVKFDDYPDNGKIEDRPSEKQRIKPPHLLSSEEKEKLKEKERLKKNYSIPKFGSGNPNRKPLSYRQAMYAESYH